MFDDFYDSATLKVAKGTDKTLATLFGAPTKVSCRLVKTEDVLRTVKDKVTSVKQKKWHVPLNSAIKEKDMLDEYVITEVKRAIGICGETHYLIVIGEK